MEAGVGRGRMAKFLPFERRGVVPHSEPVLTLIRAMGPDSQGGCMQLSPKKREAAEAVSRKSGQPLSQLSGWPATWENREKQ